MDNRIFNVNGSTKVQLRKALDCLLYDEYDKVIKVRGWYVDNTKGLVLTWLLADETSAKPFTDRMGKNKDITTDELVEELWTWLHSDDAKEISMDDWDADIDQDGSNHLGWRLYTEDWGHISINDKMDSHTIAAFKPVYLWYGK